MISRVCGASRAGFFYKSYERQYFWFEALDMIRKFALVAGLALFEQGSTVQLMVRGRGGWPWSVVSKKGTPRAERLG